MLKGYRTIIWNAVNAMIAVMAVVETQYSIPQEWMPYWLGAFIFGNFYLRMVTTGPVGKKE